MFNAPGTSQREGLLIGAVGGGDDSAAQPICRDLEVAGAGVSDRNPVVYGHRSSVERFAGADAVRNSGAFRSRSAC
jgi:hypothetical protein